MVERGRKIDDEKKTREKMEKGGNSPHSPLILFPLVSSVYDLTRSPSSEHRTLLTERLEQASPW